MIIVLEKWSKIAFTGTFPLRGKKEQYANKPNVNMEKLLLNWTELSFEKTALSFRTSEKVWFANLLILVDRTDV